MPPRRRPAAAAVEHREGALRRPRVDVLRRPARGEAPESPVREEVEWVSLSKITFSALNLRQKVVLEGRFWESPVLVAGETRGVVVNEGDATWRLWVTGTQSESLLREVGGRCKELRIHVCPDPCDRLVWAKDLIHGLRYRVQEEPAEDWWTNLEEVPRGDPPPREDDPLHRIRAEMVERTGGEEVTYSPEAGEAPVRREEVGGEKKTLKKGKKRKAKVKVQLEAPLKDVFKHTALDPDANVRHELMRKARKIRKGKKKKKKGSRSRSKESSGEETGESSDSSSLGERRIATSELFESERRSLRLWRRVPGALTNAAVLDMQEQMMTAQGYVSVPMVEGAVAPVVAQYFRAHLQPHMGVAFARESLHLATILDLCLRGRIAAAMDVASQRLKALEATSRGTATEIARRLELIGADRPSLLTTPEAGEAGREMQTEDRIMRRNTGRWHWEEKDFYKGGKGKEKGKREKGKGDGKYRDKGGRKGDGKRKEEKGDKE